MLHGITNGLKTVLGNACQEGVEGPEGTKILLSTGGHVERWLRVLYE